MPFIGDPEQDTGGSSIPKGSSERIPYGKEKQGEEGYVRWMYRDVLALMVRFSALSHLLPFVSNHSSVIITHSHRSFS